MHVIMHWYIEDNQASGIPRAG